MNRFAGTENTEPGLAAVAAKYGPRMADQIRNWPKLAEVYTRAGYGDQVMVDKEVLNAERNVERAKRDRMYALDQAEMIARARPENLWGVVPSLAQLRRDWGFGE